MKKSIFLFPLILISLISLSFIGDSTLKMKTSTAQRVSFKIRGTGYKGIFVTIGIGSSPGNGACCTGVSENTTVSFVGEVGDVVYDGKTRRVITKIYKDLEGTTIDLADYY
ncbi:MAG: hypothetical protein FGM46_09715 [Ferruginibacter sp.]|nr:hypothetical protein [Ferruginibacter sp.]